MKIHLGFRKMLFDGRDSFDLEDEEVGGEELIPEGPDNATHQGLIRIQKAALKGWIKGLNYEKQFLQNP